MYRYRRHLLFFALATGVLIWESLLSGAAIAESLAPVLNKGRKWRIGYYEGGSYINYPANLVALAHGLADLGWMPRADISVAENATDARAVWEALGRIKSDYLTFAQDAFWSADWRREIREDNREAAIAALKKGELDFMIAMGTWAGQDLANNRHAVPTMVVSSSDPVGSGIIVSPYDSGYDHVHARCDPNRYLRQVRIFYSIFRFRHLGLTYEDTTEGRSYAALKDVQRVASENHFEVITCTAPFSSVSAEESFERLVQCHQELAPRIDAYFLTIHRGVDLARMDELLAPMMDRKIPVWSQRGPREVQLGALLSIAREDFKAIGRFHAKVMAQVFNGARPRLVNQIFEDPKTIAINLQTANRIGFTPPKGLMKVVDAIYP